MKKKIKCNVCGTRFMPERLQKYTAGNEASGLLKLTTAFTAVAIFLYVPSGIKTINVLYDAFDCPQCGVQIRVGQRFPSYIKNRPCIWRGKDGVCEDGLDDEELSGIETGMENENN